jgi:glycosyltransferase involved in cell wall biosynthesis
MTEIPGQELRHGLSVFLPAFNEAENLPRLFASLLPLLRSLSIPFEVIVVDDGSADSTAETVERARQDAPEIRRIGHPCNLGYGAALRTGFAACRYPWIFFTDADGQFDPEDLLRLIPLASKADLICGYRLHRQDPWFRSLNARVYRLALRLFLGLRIQDVDCAFKLIRKKATDSLLLETTGAVLSAELLFKARRSGFRIAEVGVSHFPRWSGKPTGARPAVVLRAMRELIGLAMKERLSPGMAGEKQGITACLWSLSRIQRSRARS